MAQEKTLLIFKPDSNGLEEIILKKIIEETGVVVIEDKMIEAPMKSINEHYLGGSQSTQYYGEKYIEHHPEITKNYYQMQKYGEIVVTGLCNYLGNKILRMIILGGEDAVAKVKAKVGSTEPISSAKGTIRNEFSQDSYKVADEEGRPVNNLVHISSSQKEAIREIYNLMGIYIHK